MSYSHASVEKTNIPLFKRFEIHYPSWKTLSTSELKKTITDFLTIQQQKQFVSDSDIELFLSTFKT